MPKKKTQNKRQNKLLTTEEPFNEKSERNLRNKEPEIYETIVDFDQSGKFSKRRLENNWAKYETPISDSELDLEHEENTEVNDYSFLVENASTDFSHFEFASEKLWKETKPVVNNRIFKLDLNLLSSGLACIPFYKRINLEEENISEEDKRRCDEEATKNLEKYQVILDNFNKNNLGENKLKKHDEEKNLEFSSFKLNSDLKDNILDFSLFSDNTLLVPDLDKKNPKLESKSKDECIIKSEEKEENMEDWLDKALLLNEEKTGLSESTSEEKKIQQKEIIKSEDTIEQEYKNNTQEPQTQKITFSDNGENLEDWLDSVLDD